MFRIVRLATVTAFAFLLAAPAFAEEDLKTVEKQLQEAWEKHKSVKAKVITKTEMETPGGKMEGKGSGTFEIVRKNDKSYSRLELTQEMSMGETGMNMTQKMLTVTDGDFTYTLSEAMGQKMAAKSKIDPQSTGDPKNAFEELRNRKFELKLLPDDKVDDRPVYVIEATPKESMGPQFGTLKFYFDKKDGFMRQFEMLSKEGKPAQTMTYTDVEFDVDINPDRFKFEAPEGVTVMDRTKDMPIQPNP